MSQITPEIEAMAGSAKEAGVGTGGMVTKIAAAKIAVSAGCAMVIARGAVERPLHAIETGATCTWFLPRATPFSARKQWIAGSLVPSGILIGDDGAARALAVGKSLLPAVIVRNQQGQELGRGLVAYSIDDARLILGHKSGEIEALLGYRGRDEMIHRDDLALG